MTRPAPERARTGDVPEAKLERIDARVWRLAAVIVLGAFASGLDASLIHVALDTIGNDLSATLATTQWVATVYLLALAVSLPLAGWLADRFGPGRVWLIALGGFTVASGLCAVAVDINMLIAMRVLQGLAGGVLIPAGQTVLGRAVGSERLGRVMATLGIAVTLAPALGPVIGGLALSVGPWEWLFAINIPIGIVGIVLGVKYVPRGDKNPQSQLDWQGLALVTTGLPLVVFGITELVGSEAVPTPLAATSLAIGVILLTLYVRHARAIANPVVRIKMFRQPAFATAVVASGFSGMLLFGTGLIFPLFLQLQHNYDTLETGLRLLSVSGGTAVALPFCGRLVDRLGASKVAVAGSALCVLASLGLLALPASTPMPVVQVVLLLFGIAIAFAGVPPTIAAYKVVARQDLSQATTQVNIAQRLGGAVGGAIFTVLVAQRLHDDPVAAFRVGFACIAGVSLITLGATSAMLVSERRNKTISSR